MNSQRPALSSTSAYQVSIHYPSLALVSRGARSRCPPRSSIHKIEAHTHTLSASSNHNAQKQLRQPLIDMPPDVEGSEMDLPRTPTQSTMATTLSQAPLQATTHNETGERVPLEVLYTILEHALRVGRRVDHAYHRFLISKRGRLGHLLSVLPQHKDFIVKTYYKVNEFFIHTTGPNNQFRGGPITTCNRLRQSPVILPPRHLRQYVRDLSANFNLLCAVSHSNMVLPRMPSLQTFSRLTSLEFGFPNLDKLHVTLYISAWAIRFTALPPPQGNPLGQFFAMGPGVTTVLSELDIVLKAGSVTLETAKGFEDHLADLLSLIQLDQTAADDEEI
jgi:hypothetical protein